MSSLIRQALDQIEEVKNKEGGISGVPSGFQDLDKVTSGWQKSDLIILAARPGMGKQLLFFPLLETPQYSLISL